MLGIADDHAPSAPALSTPDEFKTVVDAMAAGRFGVAVFWDVTPPMTFRRRLRGKRLAGRDGQGSLAGSPGLLKDETATACNLVLPTNHWLESLERFEASGDALTLQQPVVAPLYDTVQGEEVFLRCLAEMGRPLARSTSSLSSDAGRTKSA